MFVFSFVRAGLFIIASIAVLPQLYFDDQLSWQIDGQLLRTFLDYQILSQTKIALPDYVFGGVGGLLLAIFFVSFANYKTKYGDLEFQLDSLILNFAKNQFSREEVAVLLQKSLEPLPDDVNSDSTLENKVILAERYKKRVAILEKSVSNEIQGLIEGFNIISTEKTYFERRMKDLAQFSVFLQKSKTFSSNDDNFTSQNREIIDYINNRKSELCEYFILRSRDFLIHFCANYVSSTRQLSNLADELSISLATRNKMDRGDPFVNAVFLALAGAILLALLTSFFEERNFVSVLAASLVAFGFCLIAPVRAFSSLSWKFLIVVTFGFLAAHFSSYTFLHVAGTGLDDPTLNLANMTDNQVRHLTIFSLLIISAFAIAIVLPSFLNKNFQRLPDFLIYILVFLGSSTIFVLIIYSYDAVKIDDFRDLAFFSLLGGTFGATLAAAKGIIYTDP